MKYANKLDELKAFEKQRKLTNVELFMKHRIRHFLEGTKLGLKYFIYGGGIYGNTLAFCRVRNNTVFSVDELMDWKNSEDKPDIENYDPILHLGGNKCFEGEIFCNHGFNFISKQLARRYRQDIETNEYKKNEDNYLNKSMLPDTIKLIEEKKNELLQDASYMHAVIINAIFKKFINDIVQDNGKITSSGKSLTIQEALDLLSNNIKKIITNIPKINF